MSNKLIKALITETVKERIQQIKEKAEASKSAHSKDVIKVLEDQAKVLDKLAVAVKKEYEKHDFGELKKKVAEFEALRDSKLAKVEALKKKYGGEEKKDSKKKVEERKLSGKEEKIVKGIKKSGQFGKKDPAIYAIATAKAKGQGKK